MAPDQRSGQDLFLQAIYRDFPDANGILVAGIPLRQPRYYNTAMRSEADDGQ
jgi:hypothetical protein